ncbi:MAG: hypothetical protein BA864_14345 [Desulfuromonadales bacterium C00003093]|nr:MAG: hypothetical protein BA864_14345 [Desulfuromonadales bacterium C00003093]
MNASVRLQCVGSGDAFGSGGRLNSCFYLAVAGQQLLLDCGCSSLIGLRRCGIDPAGIDAVVISHLHGDHFGGIPFLLLEAKYISRRQRSLTLIGPPDLQQQVEAALEALYPGVLADGLNFPIVYRQLDTATPLQQGDFQISCCQVKHGGSPHAYALRIKVADKVICYTGDTEWSEALVPLTTDSDLLLAECFAFAQPVPGHLDYQTLLKQRYRLGCQRLLLTHLGPDMLAKRAEVELEIVTDGQLIEL